MNLSNISRQIEIIKQCPQNASIIYLILSLNDDFQLNGKQELVINLLLKRQYLSLHAIHENQYQNKNMNQKPHHLW